MAGNIKLMNKTLTSHLSNITIKQPTILKDDWLLQFIKRSKFHKYPRLLIMYFERGIVYLVFLLQNQQDLG